MLHSKTNGKDGLREHGASVGTGTLTTNGHNNWLTSNALPVRICNEVIGSTKENTPCTLSGSIPNECRPVKR